MRKVILAGAGQMGRRVLQLLNRAEIEVLGFADNDPKLWGNSIEGLPVFSMEQAAALGADEIFIAVMKEARTREMTAQLRRLGYSGALCTLEAYGRTFDLRTAVLLQLYDRLKTLPGDLAELGVYQGDFAARLNGLFPERKLYLFDTFEGFDERDTRAERARGFSRAAERDFADTSPELVLSKMSAPAHVEIRKGYFPQTAPQGEERFALVSLDADLFEPTLAGLRWFYPRLVSGGVILLHDYENRRFQGVQAALEAYEREAGRVLLVPVGDLHGSAVIMKP